MHVADRDCPLLHTNGKGASELAARASATRRVFRAPRLPLFLDALPPRPALRDARLHAFPQERWFAPGKGGRWPAELLSKKLHAFYNPERGARRRGAGRPQLGQRRARHLRPAFRAPGRRRSGALPGQHPRQPLLEQRHGLPATPRRKPAPRALAEIVERAVKFRVIREGLCLPDVPETVLARYPALAAEVAALRAAGFGLLVKDASLGGAFPVLCVALLNPRDQGCFLSFGAHPTFGIALERALTELLQGRALDALDGFPEPDFDLEEVASAPNLRNPLRRFERPGRLGLLRRRSRL